MKKKYENIFDSNKRVYAYGFNFGSEDLSMIFGNLINNNPKTIDLFLINFMGGYTNIEINVNIYYDSQIWLSIENVIANLLFKMNDLLNYKNNKNNKDSINNINLIHAFIVQIDMISQFINDFNLLRLDNGDIGL